MLFRFAIVVLLLRFSNPPGRENGKSNCGNLTLEVLLLSEEAIRANSGHPSLEEDVQLPGSKTIAPMQKVTETPLFFVSHLKVQILNSRLPGHAILGLCRCPHLDEGGQTRCFPATASCVTKKVAGSAFKYTLL
jgi:hypothetical protein